MATSSPPTDPDHALRLAANETARQLQHRYDDLVPVTALREGFVFGNRRISFGSFFKGIHRPKEMKGPAALTLTTTAPKAGKPPPYDDQMDPESRTILYHYRAGPMDQPDNRALRAAHELQAPLVYFLGIAPGQYMVMQPVFVTGDYPEERAVTLEVGLPVADMKGDGLRSNEDVRAYALREARYRLHQHRFRVDVLRAYRGRCTVCALREPALVQAAHILEDVQEQGIAAIINGLALCAIHHLAYDRNLMGIDPSGVVHIGRRLLDEEDGPMLRQGLQGFHGREIALPAHVQDRPDQDRLAVRFERFSNAAA